MEPLKGKILKIIDSYTVIINLGSEQGVTEGMRFIIYEEGDMVKDPETNADLEKLEIVKAEVKATQIQQKISVAQSYEIERKIYNPLDSVMYQFTSHEYTVKEKKKITEDDIATPTIPKVKVGDLVRAVL